VITSKAASDYQFKTGQRKKAFGTKLFYPAASCGGKSVFVRQLRGPDLSTCPRPNLWRVVPGNCPFDGDSRGAHRSPFPVAKSLLPAPHWLDPKGMAGPFHCVPRAWSAPHFKVPFRILRTIANSFVAGQRCSLNACRPPCGNGPSHCPAAGGRASPPIRTTGRLRNRFLFNIYTDPAAVILCSGSRYGGSFTTRRFDKCFLRPRNSFPLEVPLTLFQRDRLFGKDTKRKAGFQPFKLRTEVPNAELVAADRVYVPAGT
jgi:hypothetical protein